MNKLCSILLTSGVLDHTFAWHHSYLAPSLTFFRDDKIEFRLLTHVSTACVYLASLQLPDKSIYQIERETEAEKRRVWKHMITYCPIADLDVFLFFLFFNIQLRNGKFIYSLLRTRRRRVCHQNEEERRIACDWAIFSRWHVFSGAFVVVCTHTTLACIWAQGRVFWGSRIYALALNQENDVWNGWCVIIFAHHDLLPFYPVHSNGNNWTRILQVREFCIRKFDRIIRKRDFEQHSCS